MSTIGMVPTDKLLKTELISLYYNYELNPLVNEITKMKWRIPSNLLLKLIKNMLNIRYRIY